ncbi:MAG: hypothetical protein KHY88_07380 [Erysipelotrichaceae bacterium]|nr:hypothetical protein [Erysipelotrichaceae bacterium]
MLHNEHGQKVVKDIFEDMKKEIGCTYISDLPANKEKLKKALQNIDLNQYSKE